MEICFTKEYSKMKALKGSGVRKLKNLFLNLTHEERVIDEI